MPSLKKIAVFITLFSFFIWACQSSSKEKPISKEPKEPSVMYEASELASLMRAMHEQSNSWKNALLADAENFELDMPEFYRRMHTAEATNPKEINDNFYAKADAFLEATNTFIHAENVNKLETYNLMIASCVDCHKDFCRGPIQKINKLVIEEKLF